MLKEELVVDRVAPDYMNINPKTCDMCIEGRAARGGFGERGPPA